ncbi:SDR family oxidoreductase [Chryseobacterium sp. BIGb0232]|uniref:SDR family oxidoreductase n=1 Tax=Chryseobacterium sp. BIGb0232 TaxID=2940598 RepID=UPI000F47F028|nr:SDR family oxidoreductase [Chryseobacterium sp. BIGb0232]MCS4304859.1 NAD(P)-dependent dehydrogenase (short-subunit alcohol dehydrogenase family) [Chryseobacterium sp. BIGb0232]ROS09716.1 NADP-dependent 3-hydroxy acid dehydrogenase YdfG [Chryseobacterium nakagawai]
MKTVLITGTCRGIGLEAALKFSRGGYKVFATMLNLESASALKEKIDDESLDITILEMDVDSDVSVKECMNSVIQQCGSLDVLVNNAGIERHGSIEELEIADFQAIMNTNYLGVLRCIKAVLPQMRKSKKGNIINISSLAGRMANSPLGAYGASKHALEAISEVLAQELYPFNVRVSIIEPGIIDTQMARNLTIGKESIYPYSKRVSIFYNESLKKPTPPCLVADKIFEVAESDEWKLRHPVGNEVEQSISWRNTMSDEQWIEWNAIDDEGWYKRMEVYFGANAMKQDK